VEDERVAEKGHILSIEAAIEAAIAAAAPDRAAANGGLRSVLRALRPLVGSRAIDAAGSAPSLERMTLGGDPPSVAQCAMLETDGARAMPTDRDPGVSAFLDGVQRSRVVGHVTGSPIVFATVGAVVRERVDRRMQTWDLPRLRHLVLAARAHLGESAWAALEATGVDPIDVTEASSRAGAGDSVPLHPLAVRARALDLIATERETLERRLAAEWCQREPRWLWIDGGVSGNLAVDANSPAFGVVKSHTTLYGDGDALRTTMALATGERGPLFLVQHRARRGVASWYLRLHGSDDGDPLHGLVRVEVAPPSSLFRPDDKTHAHPDAVAVAALAQRANDISAWILAERAPVSLPDPRWDTLTYGVYACEQFLKALIGS
jgi:hypothetical protein